VLFEVLTQKILRNSNLFEKKKRDEVKRKMKGYVDNYFFGFWKRQFASNPTEDIGREKKGLFEQRRIHQTVKRVKNNLFNYQILLQQIKEVLKSSKNEDAASANQGGPQKFKKRRNQPPMVNIEEVSQKLRKK